MPWRDQSTPFGRRLVQSLAQAISTENGPWVATMTHQLPIEAPDGGLPATYTVCLTLDENGTFLVTCRELPSLATYADDEGDALLMAELAIRDALYAQRTQPDSGD